MVEAELTHFFTNMEPSVMQYTAGSIRKLKVTFQSRIASWQQLEELYVMSILSPIGALDDW